MEQRRTKILSFLMFLGMASMAQTSLNYRITNWFEGRHCAVTPTFDDNATGQYTFARQALNNRNLLGSFYVISSTVNWDSARALASDGHEIGNHGVSNKNWVNDDSTTIHNEMSSSTNAINTQVTSQKVRTVAWPQGGGGGSSSKDSLIRAIGRNFFIGARAASGPASGYDEYDRGTLNSWYADKDYYMMIGAYLLTSSVSVNNFKTVLKNCQTDGGWLVPLYHGIVASGASGLSVNQSVFTAQMDYVEQKNDSSLIWNTTFLNASLYQQENLSHSLTTKSEDNDAWTLSLTDTLSADSIFNHPLTIRLKKPSWTVAAISQNGSSVTFTEDGDTLQFNAVPDGGDIILSKNPVSTYASSLDKKAIIYPNPSSSQCFINIPHQKADLLDISGKVLLSGKGSINVNSLEKGVYTIRIYTDQGIVNEKLSVK